VNAYPQPGREAVRTAMIGQLPLNGDRALECGRRIRERDEKSVACMIHFLTAMLSETLSERAVEPGDELRPGLITNRFDQFCRVNDVAEKERSLRHGRR
jgi:hypothetical protein